VEPIGIKPLPSVIFMVCKFKMRGEYFKGRVEEMEIFSYLFLYEAKSKGVKRSGGKEEKEEKSAPDFQGRFFTLLQGHKPFGRLFFG
jgi:hypothetical protein